MRRRDIVASVLGALCLLSFAILTIMAGRIGGQADVGHSDLGHYYVSSHGVLTEVTRGFFRYSFFWSVFSSWKFHAESSFALAI